MIKTRPTPKSESVASEAYDAYSTAIAQHFPKNTNDDSFRSHLILAIMESSDSYQAVRYINDFYEWPCSRDTITLFDNIYFDLRGITHTQTMSWVVAHNIRPQHVKGDPITFRVNPDVFITGMVGEVIPKTGTLIVTVPKTGTEEYVVMNVNVEDVVQ